MKTVIITGATSGIGFAAAHTLTRSGYHVIGIGHNEDNCVNAQKQIMTENPKGNFIYFIANLMQQREVTRIAAELSHYLIKNCDSKLYALINNAGCVRSWYTTTEEGYEQQFALNHLSGFLLTYKLLSYIKNGNGKIIMTGSGSHKNTKIHWDDIMLRKGYNPLTAYKQSKLCNVLFAKGLNDRYKAKGIRSYVVDPGLVKTNIGNKQTGGIVDFIWTLRKNVGKSLYRACRRLSLQRLLPTFVNKNLSRTDCIIICAAKKYIVNKLHLKMPTNFSN